LAARKVSTKGKRTMMARIAEASWRGSIFA